MKLGILYHDLLFVFLPLTYDDCVKRFHKKKEQSGTDPPVLWLILGLNHQINADQTMAKEHNPGKYPAEEREKYHGEWKP